MNRQTVLITGALNEIGRAVAVAFAQTGFNAIVSGRSEEQGEPLVSRLKTFKIEADYLFTDVRCEEDVRNLVDWTSIRFGGLDVAVNIVEEDTSKVSIIERAIEDFDAALKTNIRGIFLCLKHELRIMLKRKAGIIINISLSSAFDTLSGCALKELTKAAAQATKNENVRINAVVIDSVGADWLTPLTESMDQEPEPINRSAAHKRVIKPEEVAQTVIFLASEKASFINGQIISGGRMIL